MTYPLADGPAPVPSGGGHDHPHDHSDIRTDVERLRTEHAAELARLRTEHETEMAQLRTDVLAGHEAGRAADAAERAAEAAEAAAANDADQDGDRTDFDDAPPEVVEVDEGAPESLDPPPAPMPHTPPAKVQKSKGWWDKYPS